MPPGYPKGSLPGLRREIKDHVRYFHERDRYFWNVSKTVDLLNYNGDQKCRDRYTDINKTSEVPLPHYILMNFWTKWVKRVLLFVRNIVGGEWGNEGMGAKSIQKLSWLGAEFFERVFFYSVTNSFDMYCKCHHMRHHGRVVRALDWQFGGPEFKFRPGRYLDLFTMVPSSSPRPRS